MTVTKSFCVRDHLSPFKIHQYEMNQERSMLTKHFSDSTGGIDILLFLYKLLSVEQNQ